MPRTSLFIPRAAATLAAVLAIAGCASTDMSARYEQSLQRWKGATQAALVAQWGPPALAAEGTPDTTLTWIVHHDFENRGVMPQYVSAGSGAPMMLAGSTISTTPIVCTTRFVLRDGVVVSWTFSGLGCGAPD